MKSALRIVQKYYPQVRSVVDGRKGLSITVKTTDSPESKKKSPDQCALANACKRDAYDGAIISLNTAYLVRGTRAFRYIVPKAVQREIVSFDRHQDFSPGEYYLYAPTPSSRLGARRYPQPKVKANGYPLEKIRRHRTAGIRSL